MTELPGSPACQIFSVNEGLERGYATRQMPSDAAERLHAAGDPGTDSTTFVAHIQTLSPGDVKV